MLPLTVKSTTPSSPMSTRTRNFMFAMNKGSPPTYLVGEGATFSFKSQFEMVTPEACWRPRLSVITDLRVDATLSSAASRRSSVRA